MSVAVQPPASPLPVLITGATRGLGLETSRALVCRGVPVLLACRRVHAGREAKADILRSTGAADAAVRVAALDVSDLDSVRRFADEHEGERFGALVCNAGLQIVTGTRRTPAGIEETFATNHLGHFLLARRLLASVEPRGRIVFVSSGTHDPKQHTGMPHPDTRDLDAVAHGTAFASEAPSAAGKRRYTTSKLCNVLCAYELARRLGAARGASAPIVSAFDPGLMPGTGLAREYGPVARWAWRAILPVLTVAPNVNSVATSARRLADLATGALDVETAAYVSAGRVRRSSAASYDEALAKALWELSSSLCGLSPSLDAAGPS